MSIEIGRWVAGHKVTVNDPNASGTLTRVPTSEIITSENKELYVEGNMPSIYGGETITINILWCSPEAYDGAKRLMIGCQFLRYIAGTLPLSPWSGTIGGAVGNIPATSWTLTTRTYTATQAQTGPLFPAYGGIEPDEHFLFKVSGQAFGGLLKWEFVGIELRVP